MKSKRLISGVVLGLAFTTVVGWRLCRPLHVSHMAIVYDRSESPSIGCQAVASSVGRAFGIPGAAPQTTLTFIATGDQSTSYDGTLIGVFRLPISNRVMESRHAEMQRQKDFVQEIERRCKQLTVARKSPILLAIISAIAHLRIVGCGRSDVRCYLDVASDGIENVDDQIGRALRGARSARDPLSRIDNTGVEVSFCGFAQTKSSGRRSHENSRTRLQRLKEVWTSVFTKPDLVAVDPYCSAINAS